MKVWLHRRQRPQRYAFLERLLTAQALCREKLLRRQHEALQAMLRFARDNTAYYAETLRDISDAADISTLPILRKTDVVACLPDLLARGHDPRTTPVGHTGGSTGKPLAFFYDETKHELMRAGMMRSYMMSGWRPGQKILNFWGARQDTVTGGVFGNAMLDDWIAAEKTLPAHEIDAVKLADWAHFIQSYRPALLQGYASILAALARFILEEKLVMPDNLIGIYSTAEVLTDAQRALITEAFGCHVFNQYGSREIPNIACECSHGSMHVFTDMVWLESIGHRLLVTSLTNRLMPMIRYENGDSGELLEGECTCGNPFPLMKMGLCRQNDLILTPAGRHLHPSFFHHLLDGQARVEQFQFVQHSPAGITLRLAASAPLDPDTVAALRAKLHLGGDGMALSIEYLPEIKRTASGKLRFVISLL